MNNYLPVMLLKKLVVLPTQEVKIELNNKVSEKIIKLSLKHHNGDTLIVCPKDQIEEEPLVNDLPKIGVVGKIKSKIKLPNGNLRIVVTGVSRVSISEYQNLEDDKEILMANVSAINEECNDLVLATALKRKLIKTLTTYINSSNNISNSILANVGNIDNLGELTDLVATFIPLSIDKKIEYMEEVNVYNRANKLIYDLAVELEILDLDQKLEERLRKELEKNQKEFILREKLSEIKKELGEEDEHDIEIKHYEELLNSLKLSTKTKSKLELEIKKFAHTATISPESSVIRNYLDMVLSLPWNKYSQDEIDLDKIRKRLDKSHFGLEKAKERILEYVAVKKRNPNINSPIICLVGPPGVGKTSLSINIASALNKEFYKISVGGLSDTAELVGNRRTYIGSSPGKIMQAISKCNVANPLILIDEIDKMVKDYHGDPASALLDILDPEQNTMFIDNYIEEPFDLSKVTFILTANDVSKIPNALYDRLEIIELSSYSENEKVDIAKNYLLPNIFREHLLTSKNVKISDEVLMEVIRKYTKESGLRELKRVLTAIVRKIIVKHSGKDIRVTIKSSDLVLFLGKAKYDINIIDKTIRPGLVNALAYTPMGGLVLPLESCLYEGNGKVITTGCLGNIMAESIKVAISYIRSNKDIFKVNDYYFLNRDIHIHALELSVAKDGPSAGIAITTSILSLILNKSIGEDVAMTGEITLRGDILRIGGLKEKILGAYNNKIKMIFIPAANINELEEIPEAVRCELDIIPVSNFVEIFQRLFN